MHENQLISKLKLIKPAGRVLVYSVYALSKALEHNFRSIIQSQLLRASLLFKEEDFGLDLVKSKSQPVGFGFNKLNYKFARNLIGISTTENLESAQQRYERINELNAAVSPYLSKLIRRSWFALNYYDVGGSHD